MFLDRLRTVSERIDRSIALSLVAKDGMVVESVSQDDSLDLDVLAAELLSQVRAVSQNHSELEVGPVRQFSVATDDLTLMVSRLTDDYFLLLVLGPDGPYGRARFELRRSALLFEEDLL